jgi:hypothetical protein
MSAPLQVIAAVLGSEMEARRIMDALDTAGYVCIPREPTENMIEAGVVKLVEWEDSDNPYSRTLVKMIYRAMRSLETQRSE